MASLYAISRRCVSFHCVIPTALHAFYFHDCLHDAGSFVDRGLGVGSFAGSIFSSSMVRRLMISRLGIFVRLPYYMELTLAGLRIPVY